MSTPIKAVKWEVAEILRDVVLEHCQMVIMTKTDPSFKFIPPITTDFAVKNDKPHALGMNNYPRGIYLFDIIDLPLELRIPELIEYICCRCFILREGEFVLKRKYDEKRYIAPKSQPFLNKSLCVPLTDDLIKICKKTLILKENIGSNYYYYGILGLDSTESLKQRIDNLMGSGRCDRELPNVEGCTGPCVADTVYKILQQEYNPQIKNDLCKKKFKTKTIYCGKGQWKRIIVN